MFGNPAVYLSPNYKTKYLSAEDSGYIRRKLKLFPREFLLRELIFMDLDTISKLVFDVVESVRKNEDDSGAWVEFAVKFSRKNGFSPDFLLNIAKICDSKGMFREEYVFMKACALLGEGEQQIEAYFLSGVLAYFIGRKETAI